MRSAITEIYPVYLSPSQAPEGSIRITEPQVIREADYLTVQPPEGPYGPLQEYSRRLWIC